MDRGRTPLGPADMEPTRGKLDLVRHTFVSRASKLPNTDGWTAYFRLAETRASSRTSTSGFAPVRCSSSTGNAASEIADKLLKFDFARSFAGPHFAINLKAAKSVSLCRRIFASVHESAFVPCLPSRAPVVYGSYQGISCRQRRLSTAAEDVESPGGVSPPGAPRTVREPLDSYGSRCSAVSMT